jgi:hypothetical protein
MGVACFQNALTSFTRLVCLGFVVLAGIAIPQLLLLLDSSSPQLEETTLYVPLTACELVRSSTNAIIRRKHYDAFDFLIGVMMLADGADVCGKYYRNVQSKRKYDGGK